MSQPGTRLPAGRGSGGAFGPRPAPTRRDDDLARMSLLEHLEELRTRLLWIAGSLLVVFLVCWAFARPLFDFLAVPIYRYLPKGEKLVMLSVTDAFFLYIKVALLAAVFFCAPIILYHLWRFVAPGLYRNERRYAAAFILSGTFLFLAGGAFAYYVAFPFAVEFLLGVGTAFDPAITGPSYLKFLMTVMLGLAVMFELPVLIVFLARLGVVTPGFLIRNLRWAVLLIFVLAAIITPTPDVFNMSLFALPTIGLYLLGVGVAALVTRKRGDEGAAEDDSGEGGAESEAEGDSGGDEAGADEPAGSGPRDV